LRTESWSSVPRGAKLSRGHFIALSTYMGHSDIAIPIGTWGHTRTAGWIAAAGQALFTEEAR